MSTKKLQRQDVPVFPSGHRPPSDSHLLTLEPSRISNRTIDSMACASPSCLILWSLAPTSATTNTTPHTHTSTHQEHGRSHKCRIVDCGYSRGIIIVGSRLSGLRFRWLFGLGQLLGRNLCGVRGGAALRDVCLLCHGLWRASAVNPALEVADFLSDRHLRAWQATVLGLNKMDVVDGCQLSRNIRNEFENVRFALFEIIRVEA